MNSRSSHQPFQYKEYPQSKRIALPRIANFKGLPTEVAIRRRRSRRSFSNEEITLEELSRLLMVSVGITGERWGQERRAAPSAGATYPIETYLAIHRVTGLEAGLYHYAVQAHALELLEARDLSSEIVHIGLMQDFLGQANLVIVFSAVFPRLSWKYQERSYTYALLETGHLGQNIYLTATSMGLGACAVGSFSDDDLNTLLGTDGFQEAAVYVLAVGKVE